VISLAPLHQQAGCRLEVGSSEPRAGAGGAGQVLTRAAIGRSRIVLITAALAHVLLLLLPRLLLLLLPSWRLLPLLLQPSWRQLLLPLQLLLEHVTSSLLLLLLLIIF
jgi:hypothetical protein